MPRSIEIADLLASHGVYLQRTHRDPAGHAEGSAALTLPCSRPRIERALRALGAAAHCDVRLLRALEDGA
ncbi:MAG: hypothetical protein H0U19_07500 [Acidobacteria bacterium]|nr:hypothetical protein [Acidobacteriota bacterium]